MTIRYAIVNSVRTTQLSPMSMETFDQVLKQHFSDFKTITAEQRQYEKLIVGWEFVPQYKAKLKTYEDGSSHYSRCHDNVIALNFLILDIDNDIKLELPKISFDEAVESMQGISCLFYTSFNHKNVDKGGYDRFRIVVELTKPIPLEIYQPSNGTNGVAGGLQLLFPWAARESFKPSQPFYMPVQVEERKNLSRSLRIHGEPLDWEQVEKAPLQKIGFSREGIVIESLPTPLIKSTDANVPIRLTDGTRTTVGALYYALGEGFENRRACFSTVREEKNASACAFREGRYLIMHDFVAQNKKRVRYEIEQAPRSFEELMNKRKSRKINQR